MIRGLINLRTISASYSRKRALASQAQMRSQPPRRAILYVPGDNSRHIEKITKLVETSRIDCIVFDCEDGVAMNRKDAARNSICEFFANKIPTIKTKSLVDWSVRINSVHSGHLHNDLKVVLSAKHRPNTLLLPKVQSTEDLDKFAEILNDVLCGEALNEKINLIYYAESCKAVMDLPDICRHAVKLSMDKQCQFEPVGIVFGSDDYLANLGASRNVQDSTNILYARQRVVMIAKAFNLQAIDLVYIDFKDSEGLKLQSVEGANMGYTGKQVIHPQQVPIVQESFLPTPDKIQWATEILEAYKEHQTLGKGAFVFRNQMIDNPTVDQAANIVKLSQLDTK